LSHEVASDHESQSRDSEESESGSNITTRLKVVAIVALAHVTYDVGQSTLTKTCLTSLGNNANYFPEGYDRPPGAESIPNPRSDEAFLFMDFFFTGGFHMPPYPVLLDILHKFQVQLPQLMLNAIVQISKFIWVVTTCVGCPTADIFAQHYELHYQNNKIQLEWSESTITAQFGCITIHPSRFGSRSRLTPAVKNKWVSGWDDNWLYINVPLEQTTDVHGRGTYPLSCTELCDRGHI
jgi:hypothetical protein